jgi:hypothetical protein
MRKYFEQQQYFVSHSIIKSKTLFFRLYRKFFEIKDDNKFQCNYSILAVIHFEYTWLKTFFLFCKYSLNERVDEIRCINLFLLVKRHLIKTNC